MNDNTIDKHISTIDIKSDVYEHEEIYSGPVVAATLASLLAFFTLMVTHHISRLSPSLDRLIHSYGYWIPGSVGSGSDGSIGSYSGKETLALAVWMTSWAVFHFLWKKQEFQLSFWLLIFWGCLALLTLGFFHPIIDPVVLLIAGFFGLP
jgi:hypothetical protein